jgi:hypothetical protein
MFDEFVLGSEFFEGLQRVDARIAEQVRKAGCPRCEGPLHRADYPRKPRGGAAAALGEDQTTRFSFCCGAEGCRKRATPPSLRFLGRRVYVEACVIVAAVIGAALAKASAKEVRAATGVPWRTVGRWDSWWRRGFVRTSVFAEIAARFVGLSRELPGSILEQMRTPVVERLDLMARWLAPITTASVPNGSRFVRGVA